MCHLEEPNSPKSWNQDCALGNCKQCPDPEIVFPIPEKSIAEKLITYSRWEQTTKTYKDPKSGKSVDKKIFGLVSVTITVGDLIRKCVDPCHKAMKDAEVST